MTATLTRLPGSLWNDDVSKEPLRHGLSAFPTRVVAVTVRVDGRDAVRVPFSFGVEIPWEPARVPMSPRPSPVRSSDLSLHLRGCVNDHVRAGFGSTAAADGPSPQTNNG